MSANSDTPASEGSADSLFQFACFGQGAAARDRLVEPETGANFSNVPTFGADGVAAAGGIFVIEISSGLGPRRRDILSNLASEPSHLVIVTADVLVMMDVLQLI